MEKRLGEEDSLCKKKGGREPRRNKRTIAGGLGFRGGGAEVGGGGNGEGEVRRGRE
jgi:hypothetical protein